MVTKVSSLALFLASNTAAIARLEQAGQLYNDIQNAVDTIEHTINRPIPDRLCGKCVVLYEGFPCDLALYAPRHATEVICPRCKTTHNIEQLIDTALGEVDGWLFTAKEILDTMASIGEPISDRTWRHWRKTGAIQSRNELGAEPKYFIGEVRHLRRTQAKLRAS